MNQKFTRSRRQFLKGTAAVLGFPTIVPSSVFGQNAPSNRITMAVLGWGMMGPGGMMAWGYSPFGWIGMAFMWLIPVGVITLIVFGVAALVQNAGNLTPPTSQNSCSNCGKSVQADWKNCPYCGTALK